MNGPTAAVVISFLLMCVKRLLLSLTPLLRYDTHAPPGYADLDAETHALFCLHHLSIHLMIGRKWTFVLLYCSSSGG